MFLLYINDLHHAIKFSLVHHFADDTNILHINRSPKQLAKQVNIDLKLLSHWLRSNKIALNEGKSEYIIFKDPQKPIHYDIRISVNGTKLLPSTCIKYLGVLIDSDLSWKSQINGTVIKLKRGALAKLRHFVPLNVLLLVYFAIFHSHLQYCSQILGQPNGTIINRIKILQNHAVHLMSFAAPRTSPSVLFSNLNLLKFSYIVLLQNVSLLHNLYHNKIPDSVQNLFAIDFSHYGIRGSKYGLVSHPSVRTTNFGLHSIRYYSIKTWIDLQDTPF